MKYVLISMFSLLASCNNNSIRDSKQTDSNNTTSLDSLQQHLSLQFNAFQQIDSSDYLLFPLTIEIEEDDKSKFGSSFDSGDYSRGNQDYLWNIIFYNTSTGITHLLTDSLKMIIRDYSLSANQAYSLEKSTSFIFYNVTNIDFNKDGKLDSKDPTSLFLSDKKGQYFRQISPNGCHVKEWQLLAYADKIIMLALEDTNGDKLFDHKDITVPFQFDLNSNQPAKRIFNPQTNDQLTKQFLETWQPQQ